MMLTRGPTAMRSNGSSSEAADENKDEFSRQLCDITRGAVKHIVESGSGTNVAFPILNNARALAEMAYESNRTEGAKPVACKEGCDWCCYQRVRVSAVEAVSIVNYLLQMKDAERRAALIARVRELDAVSRGLRNDERDALHVPCAFLVDRRCEIHEVRPMACSWYTSWFVEECVIRQQAGIAHSKIHADPARTVAYDAVRKGMVEGLAGAIPGAGEANLELIAAVADALDWDNPESEWLAGKPIFAKAHISKKGD